MSILIFLLTTVLAVVLLVDAERNTNQLLGAPRRNPGRSVGGGGRGRQDRESPPFTIANMTCDFFVQPLNHFDLPRNKSGFFQQRFCYYNGYVDNNKINHDDDDDDESTALDQAPVFLYTGNESPLEEYINHTGLIWESAPQFGAQVVFVEHRYEGKSLPNPDIPNCLAYSASYQALADYANFIENYLFGTVNGQRSSRRPVIVFGGSYGGMLSAWIRMMYPHLVTGAIAGSAPIGGFPTNRPKSIDAAFTVIRHGLTQPYPPTAAKSTGQQDADNGDEKNHCADNLLAAWPLVQILSQEETGRKLLQESFRLCEKPTTNAQILTSWAQSPWFDLAEGSFPYPSSYITFALTHRLVNLPAWPLQAACWKHSELHKDWDIKFEGSQTNVLYNITYGDSGLTVAVDWDEATPFTPCNQRGHDRQHCLEASLRGSESIRGLLESVRNAVSVWYNVTKDIPCFDLTAAPNQQTLSSTPTSIQPDRQGTVKLERNLRAEDRSAADQCAHRMKEGSWGTFRVRLVHLSNDLSVPRTDPLCPRTSNTLIRVHLL